jgi:hypothetical protein
MWPITAQVYSWIEVPLKSLRQKFGIPRPLLYKSEDRELANEQVKGDQRYLTLWYDAWSALPPPLHPPTQCTAMKYVVYVTLWKLLAETLVTNLVKQFSEDSRRQQSSEDKYFETSTMHQ